MPWSLKAWVSGRGCGGCLVSPPVSLCGDLGNFSGVHFSGSRSERWGILRDENGEKGGSGAGLVISNHEKFLAWHGSEAHHQSRSETPPWQRFPVDVFGRPSTITKSAGDPKGLDEIQPAGGPRSSPRAGTRGSGVPPTRSRPAAPGGRPGGPLHKDFLAHILRRHPPRVAIRADRAIELDPPRPE